MRERLAVLRRAESIRKNRKKKSRARVAFYKDPFKSVIGSRVVVSWNRGRSLRTTWRECTKTGRGSER